MKAAHFDLMYIRALLLFVLVCGVSRASDSPVLYVADGQIISHGFEVFATDVSLNLDAKPQLFFIIDHMLLSDKDGEKERIDPRWVMADQTLTIELDGKKYEKKGTRIIYDLRQFPMPFWKAVVRTKAVLYWQEKGSNGNSVERSLGSSSEVYVGNLLCAMVYAVLLSGFVVWVLFTWARKKRKRSLYLLCGSDNFLSLSRTQLFSWTVAIGVMVLCFGFIHLEPPHIPESLVALMGMSILTGTLSATVKSPGTAPGGAGGQNVPGSDPQAVPAAAGLGVSPVVLVDRKPNWSDLISTWDGIKVDLSLPKAQMVFWTLIVLILFVFKTIINGVLWEVPWELVALTGFSQAGYIGDKFINAPK